MAELDTLEKHLLSEIAKLERRQAETELELRTLQRLLLMARKRKISKTQVTRSNGIQRVMVEQTILDHLTSAGRRGLPSRQLYMAGQKTVSDLGRSTFASYLRRLQERGLIESPEYGLWRLTNPSRTI